MQGNKTGIFIFLFIVGCRSLDDQTSDIVVVPLQYQYTDTLIEGGAFKFFQNKKNDTMIDYRVEKIKGAIGLLHIQDIIEEAKRPNPGSLSIKHLFINHPKNKNMNQQSTLEQLQELKLTGMAKRYVTKK